MLWFTTKVHTDKGNICSLSVIKQQLDLRDYATPIADRLQQNTAEKVSTLLIGLLYLYK